MIEDDIEMWNAIGLQTLLKQMQQIVTDDLRVGEVGDRGALVVRRDWLVSRAGRPFYALRQLLYPSIYRLKECQVIISELIDLSSPVVRRDA